MEIRKTDLIDEVTRTRGVESKAAAERAVNTIFNTITQAMGNGDTVNITGFGKFEVVDKKPRRGHNPQTGEEIEIPGHKAVHFKAGTNLKKSVAD